MCLLGADRGRVLIDGRPAAQMTAGERARLLSYLPQGQDVHWPLSVERLVALGRLPHLAPFSRLDEADREAVHRALAAADVLHLPGRVATELSGGERARVRPALRSQSAVWGERVSVRVDRGGGRIL